MVICLKEQQLLHYSSDCGCKTSVVPFIHFKSGVLSTEPTQPKSVPTHCNSCDAGILLRHRVAAAAPQGLHLQAPLHDPPTLNPHWASSPLWGSCCRDNDRTEMTFGQLKGRFQYTIYCIRQRTCCSTCHTVRQVWLQTSPTWWQNCKRQPPQPTHPRSRCAAVKATHEITRLKQFITLVWP